MADEEKKAAESALDEPTSKHPSSAKLAAVEDALLAAARSAADRTEAAAGLAPEPEPESEAEKKPPEPVNKVQEWSIAIFMMLAMGAFFWMVLRYLRP